MSGWGAITSHITAVKERQEARERGESPFKPVIMPLFVKSGEDPAIVSFLPNAQGNVEPWANFVHTLPPPPGKKMMVTRKCLGKSQCPFCEQQNPAKFRAFFSVVDHRTREFEYKKGDKAGQKGISKDQVCYYECSAANADMLLQKFTKAQKKVKVDGLQDAIVEISKYGSGTSTTTSYEFEDRKDTEYVIPAEAEPIDFDDLFSVGGTGSVTPKSTESPLYD
jgi:hypothetical protein